MAVSVVVFRWGLPQWLHLHFFPGHSGPGQESTALQVQVSAVVLWLGVTPILPLHVLNVLGSRLS